MNTPAFRASCSVAYIAVVHFTLSGRRSAQNWSESVSVCRTDFMALDRSPDLFAYRFYVLVPFFLF